MTQQQQTPNPTPAQAAHPAEGNQNQARNGASQGPVQTVRSGAIGGSIWQNKNDRIGVTFSRAWKNAEGESGHSKTFYAGNRAQLHEVIDKACDVAEALERATAIRINQLSDGVSKESAGDQGGETDR